MKNHDLAINEINRLVEEFNSYLQNNRMVKTLNTDYSHSNLHYLHFENLEKNAYQFQLDNYRNPYKCGVYFFFASHLNDDEKTDLYIGQSSLQSIGSRLDSYLKGAEVFNNGITKHFRKGNQIVEMLSFIELDDDINFMAPALKLFLIKKWKEDNVRLLNGTGNK